MQDATATIEAQWRRLQRHMELVSGFWLAFVFAERRDARILCERATRMLEATGRRMTVVHQEHPIALIGVLAMLLGEEAKALPCIWIEAIPDRVSDDWFKAWGNLALRMNERRDLLRRHLQGGLVLAAPPEIMPHIRDGASDLWQARSLVLEVAKPTAKVREQSEIEKLTDLLEQHKKESSTLRHVDNVVRGTAGVDPLMSVLVAARNAAENDMPVLITGAQRSGKRQLAQFIHDESRRGAKALVVVDAWKLSLLEMLGYVRGAFLGAMAPRAGLVERTDGGTLVVHEIGALTSEAQEALVRVLEKREVVRMGDAQARRVDVRLIATTSRDLEDMCREGTFRRDLYHHLSVAPIAIPTEQEKSSALTSLH